jgi:hypothetical protein
MQGWLDAAALAPMLTRDSPSEHKSLEEPCLRQMCGIPGLTDVSHMTYAPRPFGRFGLIGQHRIISDSAIKPFLGSKSGLMTPGEMTSVLDCVRRRFSTERRQSAVSCLADDAGGCIPDARA